MIRKALWVDGWSTPARVKARLKMITQGRLQPRASHGTGDWSQDAAQGDSSRHMCLAGTTGEAIAVLKTRLQRRIRTDSCTYVKALQMCLKQKDLLAAKQVHDCMIQSGMDKNSYAATTLLNVYIRCGRFLDARRVFDELEKESVLTWNMMIAGYAKCGHAGSARDLFKLMRQDGARPNDGTTFVAVLAACCNAGLLDHGRRLFSAMTQDYGIEPDVVHYTCMVDLLGRAGHFEEVKLFISDMPIEADAVTWKALLGACRIHGNVELGELAAKEAFNLEPNNAAGYVLLCNIYAAAGEWEKRSSVRTMMRKRGVRNEPECSWIEVDNKIHEFGAGKTSHPEAKAISSELSKVTERLKAEGYVPDIQLVNIDEEDEELTLCSHSEKLAIAYGLMRISSGKPIRVYKNLRVCSDCHTATKLISKVTGREILARNANRFHHFQDGVCSCGDYW